MMKSLSVLCSSLLLLAACDIDLGPSNVKVSEQPAAGLTDASFDQGYLQQLVEETRQAAEASLQQAYDRNNIPAQERTSHAKANGRYEWIGERQLAVIDLSYSANPMRVMRVVGLADDRLLTISCISPQGAPLAFDADSGECAEAIAAHFGSE
ncbi:MAG: hypothetical protein P8103_16425 [Candidatus Thiodiazotropha sp.]